jgi:hypothetical protein
LVPAGNPHAGKYQDGLTARLLRLVFLENFIFICGTPRKQHVIDDFGQPGREPLGWVGHMEYPQHDCMDAQSQ